MALEKKHEKMVGKSNAKAYHRISNVDIDIESRALRIVVSIYANKKTAIDGGVSIDSQSYIIKGVEFDAFLNGASTPGSSVKESLFKSCYDWVVGNVTYYSDAASV